MSTSPEAIPGHDHAGVDVFLQVLTFVQHPPTSFVVFGAKPPAAPGVESGGADFQKGGAFFIVEVLFSIHHHCFRLLWNVEVRPNVAVMEPDYNTTTRPQITIDEREISNFEFASAGYSLFKINVLWKYERLKEPSEILKLEVWEGGNSTILIF
jgi:hypothetical protein